MKTNSRTLLVAESRLADLQIWCEATVDGGAYLVVPVDTKRVPLWEFHSPHTSMESACAEVASRIDRYAADALPSQKQALAAEAELFRQPVEPVITKTVVHWQMVQLTQAWPEQRAAVTERIRRALAPLGVGLASGWFADTDRPGVAFSTPVGVPLIEACAEIHHDLRDDPADLVKAAMDQQGAFVARIVTAPDFPSAHNALVERIRTVG